MFKSNHIHTVFFSASSVGLNRKKSERLQCFYARDLKRKMFGTCAGILYDVVLD